MFEKDEFRVAWKKKEPHSTTSWEIVSVKTSIALLEALKSI